MTETESTRVDRGFARLDFHFIETEPFHNKWYEPAQYAVKRSELVYDHTEVD